MQILIEIMAAIVVWAATLVFAQLGIDLDLARPPARHETRAVERTPHAEARPSAEAADGDCPDAKGAAVHRI